MEETKNIELRDMREMFAWQSQDALRMLFEGHKGVEARNLVTLYVALTLKAAQTFDSVLLTQNNDIIEYTGLHKDWVPEGLRLLEADGLIETEILRGNDGKYVGKRITLLPAPQYKQEKGPFLCPNVVKKEEPGKPADRPRRNHMVDRDTWDSLKDIVQYAVDIGAFGTRMPLDTGGCEPVEATKEIKTVIRYIIELSNGDFGHNHGLDLVYDPTNFRQVIVEALDEFVKMKTDPAIWPNDKSTLPTSFSTWFVNPRTGFSWFGRCMKGVKTNAEHYRGHGEQDAEKATPDVTDEHMGLILRWWRERNHAINDKQRIQLRYNLQRVIDVHKQIWERYGQYYAKTGGWFGYFGGRSPDMFISKFCDYLSELGGDPHHAKVSPESMSFAGYLTWIGNEYKFDLNLTEPERQRLIERAKPRPKDTEPVQLIADPWKDPVLRRMLLGDLADDPRVFPNG